MWKKQVIIILCILWIGGSLAKSFHPTSFDYDYREDSRKSSNNYRGKSESTTPRPSFQQYWESFINNIPTLPPLRWNMTNSLSSLFNAGAQQIMETPVGVHEMMEEEEPNKRRKNSKRKSTKKNKNRKIAHSRVHSNYYNYPTPVFNGGYQQIQLQPLGVDEKHAMHFYEPKTGQYYAMQMISGPPSLYNPNYYYNNQESKANEEPNNNDETYYNDESYGNESYNEEKQEQNNEYDIETKDYDNENNEDEKESTGIEDYEDDVVLADNWGYTDDEVFADRKLKGSLKPTVTGNTVKVQKHRLNPETKEDVMILLTKDQKVVGKRNKPTVKKVTTKEEEEMESVRNVLGTFVKDNSIKRGRQSANTKQSTRLVEKPGQKERYYIFPADFWL